MGLAEHRSREIRSFVLRQGRLSQAQKRALDEDLPQFAFNQEHCLSPHSAFSQVQPLTLEIGFGNGESLLEMAATSPDRNFLGFEVHSPGVGHLLLGIKRLGLTNLRVSQADALTYLRAFPRGELACLQIFFPDPWNKKKHHERRLINADFMSLAADKLALGGLMHVATDWQPYAEEVRALLVKILDLYLLMRRRGLRRSMSVEGGGSSMSSPI